MMERLERSFYAFTRHAGSPDDRRAAVAANRLIFDQPAKHSNIYSWNVWQQVPPFTVNQSCAAAQEPDWATAPCGAKAKPAEQAPGD